MAWKMVLQGMAKKLASTGLPSTSNPDDSYRAVLADIADLLEAGRRFATRSVNAIMTATY